MTRSFIVLAAVVIAACGGGRPATAPLLPDPGAGADAAPPPDAAPTLGDRLRAWCDLPSAVAAGVSGEERDAAMADAFKAKVESPEITELMERLAKEANSEEELAGRIHAELDDQHITTCAMLDELEAGLEQRAADMVVGNQRLTDALAAKQAKAPTEPLKAYKIHATGTLTTTAGTMPSKHVRVYVAPDPAKQKTLMWREDLTFGKTTASLGLIEDVAWKSVKDPATGKLEVSVLEADEQRAFAFDLAHDPELVLWTALHDGKPLAGPDEDIDGKPQFVVFVTFGDGAAAKLFLDKATKLITRIESTFAGSHAIDDLGDYRKVSGIMIAYKRTTTDPRAGSKLEIVLDKVTINPKVNPKIFQRPTPPK